MADMTFINSKIDILHPGNSNATTIGTLPTANKPVLGTDFSTPVKLTVQGELYRRLILEYAGFCPLTLVRTGVLVPGNWNNGLLRYKDKLYAFETVEKAKEWARDPDQYIETLLNRVSKERPDLVQLLHLYQYIPIVDNVESVGTGKRQRVVSSVCDIIHPCHLPGQD